MLARESNKVDAIKKCVHHRVQQRNQTTRRFEARMRNLVRASCRCGRTRVISDHVRRPQTSALYGLRRDMQKFGINQ